MMILRERTTISQKKSKTTEAVANRGVDTDAPRGENGDQKKGRKKNFEMHKIRDKMECDIQHLVEGKKTFTPRKKYPNCILQK